MKWARLRPAGKDIVGFQVVRLVLAVFFVHLFLLSSADAVGASEQSERTAQTAANLHRADFRIVGTTCAACLKRIASEISAVKGVIKADVSIFAPYGGVIIYDLTRTSLEKIQAAIASEKVVLEGLKDKAITKVPAVIVPEK